MFDSGEPYQFQFCYNYGLQEFIEAYAFYTYLSEKRLFTYEELRNLLDIEVRTSTGSAKQQLLLAPTEYLLGLSDVTGELMRFMISIAASPVAGKYAELKQQVFNICHFLQDVHTVFLRFESLPVVHKK